MIFFGQETNSESLLEVPCRYPNFEITEISRLYPNPFAR
jgi:hypothetical protein